MRYTVKKVKTEQPLCITIEFEDGVVKGMSLFDILESKPELRKLQDNPVVFLKPIIGASKDNIEWWSNGEKVCLDATVVYDKGQELSKREAESHLKYVEMSDVYQCDLKPQFDDYVFRAPFTVRVANYINLPESADCSNAKVKYRQLLKHHPNIIDVGTYQDVRNTDSPQLLKLLEECAAGRIDVIFSDSIFTFANTITTSLEIARQLYDIGVMVYFNSEYFLSDSYALDTITRIYRELSDERSMPQLLLGSNDVLRILAPDKKS